MVLVGGTKTLKKRKRQTHRDTEESCGGDGLSLLLNTLSILVSCYPLYRLAVNNF